MILCTFVASFWARISIFQIFSLSTAITLRYLIFFYLSCMHIQVLFWSGRSRLIGNLRFFLILCLILVVRFQILFWWLLFEKLLLFSPLTRRWLLWARFFDNAFSVRNIAYVTRSMTNMANSIIQRYSVVLVHTNTNKRVRRSVLFCIGTTFLVCLKWVDTFSINLFYIFRYVFACIVCICCIIFTFLCICFIHVFLYKVVAVDFQLLRFWNGVLLI